MPDRPQPSLAPLTLSSLALTSSSSLALVESDSMDEDLQFVFDWDDTLFPCSWLNLGKIKLRDLVITTEQAEILRRLDDVVSALVKKADAMGDVTIITNALPGWVSDSSRRLLPKVFRVLCERQIPVLSAQRHGKSTGEKNTDLWKVHSFRVAVLQPALEMFPHVKVIAFGDRKSDEDALAKNCSGSRARCLHQQIMPYSTAASLIEQLQRISASLPLLIDFTVKFATLKAHAIPTAETVCTAWWTGTGVRLVLPPVEDERKSFQVSPAVQA